jgi:hypothetical protein
MGLLIDVAAKKITALSVPKNLLRYQQPKQFPIISRLTLLVGQESLTRIHESSSVGGSKCITELRAIAVHPSSLTSQSILPSHVTGIGAEKSQQRDKSTEVAQRPRVSWTALHSSKEGLLLAPLSIHNDGPVP